MAKSTSGPSGQLSWFACVRVQSASAGKSTRQSAPVSGASVGRFPSRLRSRLGLQGAIPTSGTVRQYSGYAANDRRLPARAQVEILFTIAVLAMLVGAVVIALHLPVTRDDGPDIVSVDPGVLYRSGQIDADTLGRFSDMLGIRTVICLRGKPDPTSTSSDDRLQLTTRQEAQQRDIPYVDIPVAPGAGLTDGQVRAFLEILGDRQSRPVLVHCRGGRHRTGMMVAAYRMAVQGWTADEAIREMAVYGFNVSDARHKDLVDFVRSFDPGPYRELASAIPASPMRLADIPGTQSVSAVRRITGIEPADQLLTFLLKQLTNPWVLFGFAAQIAFFMRFLLQWVASERRGRSYVPVVFWYFSLAGGIMLFTYAVHRRDLVFMAGQGLGCIIYLRNLVLIMRRQNRYRDVIENRSGNGGSSREPADPADMPFTADNKDGHTNEYKASQADNGEPSPGTGNAHTGPAAVAGNLRSSRFTPRERSSRLHGLRYYQRHRRYHWQRSSRYQQQW